MKKYKTILLISTLAIGNFLAIPLLSSSCSNYLDFRKKILNEISNIEDDKYKIDSNNKKTLVKKSIINQINFQPSTDLLKNEILKIRSNSVGSLDKKVQQDAFKELNEAIKLAKKYKEFYEHTLLNAEAIEKELNTAITDLDFDNIKKNLTKEKIIKNFLSTFRKINNLFKKEISKKNFDTELFNKANKMLFDARKYVSYLQAYVEKIVNVSKLYSRYNYYSTIFKIENISFPDYLKAFKNFKEYLLNKNINSFDVSKFEEIVNPFIKEDNIVTNEINKWVKYNFELRKIFSHIKLALEGMLINKVFNSIYKDGLSLDDNTLENIKKTYKEMKNKWNKLNYKKFEFIPSLETDKIKEFINDIFNLFNNEFMRLWTKVINENKTISQEKFTKIKQLYEQGHKIASIKQNKSNLNFMFNQLEIFKFSSYFTEFYLRSKLIFKFVYGDNYLEGITLDKIDKNEVKFNFKLLNNLLNNKNITSNQLYTLSMKKI